MIGVVTAGVPFDDVGRELRDVATLEGADDLHHLRVSGRPAREHIRDAHVLHVGGGPAVEIVDTPFPLRIDAVTVQHALDPRRDGPLPCRVVGDDLFERPAGGQLLVESFRRQRVDDRT